MLLRSVVIVEIIIEDFFVFQEAVDVWSGGVMAFELLTSSPAVSMLEGKDKVRYICIADTRFLCTFEILNMKVYLFKVETCKVLHKTLS